MDMALCCVYVMMTVIELRVDSSLREPLLFVLLSFWQCRSVGSLAAVECICSPLLRFCKVNDATVSKVFTFLEKITLGPSSVLHMASG